jgi:amidase
MVGTTRFEHGPRVPPMRQAGETKRLVAQRRAPRTLSPTQATRSLAFVLLLLFCLLLHAAPLILPFPSSRHPMRAFFLKHVAAAVVSIILASACSTGSNTKVPGGSGGGGGSSTGTGGMGGAGGGTTGTGGAGGGSTGGGGQMADGGVVMPPMGDESPAAIETLSEALVERSIASLQDDLASMRVTSRQLVLAYTMRIQTANPKLNAVISLNSKALEEATVLDAERASGMLRGPLHGIPIAVKDNIQAVGMPTTAGTIALKDWEPPFDASVVENLKASGAIVLAKTTLTELANFFSTSTDFVGGWNALKGFSFTPYDLRLDPREGFTAKPVAPAGGSSNGGGTAASLWAANVGTETSGSILDPALCNMLVGLKPTLGRLSRYGIIPITSDQDTAGPMGRTVSDVAVLLGAMEGKAVDPNDSSTSKCQPPANRDYTAFLKDKDLTGVRIGVPRAYTTKKVKIGDRDPESWGSEIVAGDVFEKVIEVLKSRGATIVENADLPSYAATNPQDNIWGWYFCTSEAKGADSKVCSDVLRYGMRRDFAKWLASVQAKPPPFKSLTELVAFNAANKDTAIPFGQDILEAVELQDSPEDASKYGADRAKDVRLAESQGLQSAMLSAQVDVLVMPDRSGYEVAAIAGYPSIMVPAGKVSYDSQVVESYGEPPYPANFEIIPVPWGVSFIGKPCEEGKLLKVAFHYEQASKAAGLARVAPPKIR